MVWKNSRARLRMPAAGRMEICRKGVAAIRQNQSPRGVYRVAQDRAVAVIGAEDLAHHRALHVVGFRRILFHLVVCVAAADDGLSLQRLWIPLFVRYFAGEDASQVLLEIKFRNRAE